MIAECVVVAGSAGSIFGGVFAAPFLWQYMQRRSGERTIRKLIERDPGAAAAVLKVQAAERAGRLQLAESEPGPQGTRGHPPGR